MLGNLSYVHPKYDLWKYELLMIYEFFQSFYSFGLFRLLAEVTQNLWLHLLSQWCLLYLYIWLSIAIYDSSIACE